MTKINNVPDYAKDMEFIVVREIDGEYWFYGGYNRDAEKAYRVAEQVDGIVAHNLRV